MNIPRIFRRSEWLARIRQWCWRRLGIAWTLKSSVTVRIESESDFITFGDLFLNKEYDRAIDLLVCRSLSDCYVVDLGANVGYFFLRLTDILIESKSMVRTNYFGVEPNPECYKRVSNEIRKYKTAFSSADVVQGLVGEREGVGSFASLPFSIGSSVVEKGGKDTPYIDLYNWLSSDKNIGLLKIDIEGSEEVFLKNYGELLSRTDVLVIEIHGNMCDAGKCRDYIQHSGLVLLESSRPTAHFFVELYARNPLPNEA